MRTTMPDPGKQGPDEGTARVEQLLRVAASWEPEAPAPDRLAERAMARLDSRKREQERRERSYTHRRTTTWWGFGTISASAAVLLMLYGKIGPEETVVPERNAAVATMQPIIAAPTPPGPQTEISYNTSVADAGAATALPAQPVENNSEKVPTTTVVKTTPRRYHSPIPSVAWQSNRRASRRQRRARASYYAANRGGAKRDTGTKGTVPVKTTPDPKSMWTTETVARDDYRVLLPVVLTEPSPDDTGMATRPAVIEVSYDPNAAQYAAYR